MFENTHDSQAPQITKPTKILRMVKHSRMGGSIPVWQKPETEQEKITQNIADALGKSGQKSNFENALSLHNKDLDDHNINDQDEFGFGDIIDMVNPLHHIPVVGSIYREITGDTIKPIGKVIGGGVFGGPVGVGSGIVNVIAEEETGKDLTGNALSMVLPNKKPSFDQEKNKNNPTATLNNATQLAAQSADLNALPGSTLSFANLKHDNRSIEKKNYEQPHSYHKSSSRTAGSMPVYHDNSLETSNTLTANLSPREAITTFSIRRLSE